MVTAPNSAIKMFKLIIIFTATVLFAACSPRQPERPKHIPAYAEWAGGSDGGVWIACHNMKPPLYECTIFDADGKLWIEGAYAIRGSTLIGNYEGYDGTRILLKDGGYLEQTHSSPAVRSSKFNGF